MNWKILPLVLLVRSLLSVVTAGDGIQVSTTAGVIEGKQDNGLRVFLGIPYARPPVGSLRWRPPSPHPGWTGVRPAKEFGHHAAQGLYYDDIVFRDSGWDEDCLSLNVWTPARRAGEKMPVIVWIHGGGLQAGGSSCPGQDGSVLAKEGVVMVSINYRLGVFGFLVHPALVAESPQKAAGNYGLLDQVEALRWVRANIASFGGDPECVTVIGESAGSESISALMASPLAKGLFQRAIGESGAMFFGADNTIERRAPIDALLMKEKFGAETAEQLRAIPAEKLVAAFSRQDDRGGHAFGAVVEPLFLPSDLEEVFGSGLQNDVPLLAGWNKDEWHVPEATLATLDERLIRMFGALADEARPFYLAASDADAARSATDLESDMNIDWTTWRWLDRHANTGKSSVYRYFFSQVRPLNSGESERGASHTAELVYVFGTMKTEPKTPWRSEHYELGSLIRRYWINFAKTGNPNAPGLPVWPRYSAEAEWSYMRLDTKPLVEVDLARAKYDFLTRTKLIWMRY